MLTAKKNSIGLGVGIVLKIPEWAIFEHYLKLKFSTTNNETEYEAFIVRLQYAKKLKVLELYIFSDSKMVVNQVIRKFKA